MRVACAQINSRIGDFEANARRIAAAYHAAGQADLVVFPELVVSGYPPRDLLFQQRFVQQAQQITRNLAELTEHGPPMIVGAPLQSPHGLQNTAVVLAEGRIQLIQPKRHLPSYDVFHEARWFVPGTRLHRVQLPNLPPFEILICEDLWQSPPLTASTAICLNASPFRKGILERRRRLATNRLIYCNAVGGQDDLIFDGGSFDTETGYLPRFQEAVGIPDQPPDTHQELKRALILGIRDFFNKSGIKRAVLGLSGGIDSAVTACLATEALGADRVVALALPSKFTDPRSTESARELARNLNIEFHTRPIHALHEAALAVTEARGTAAENLQARLRMLLLMEEVNSRGGLLLNTSNKTELSLGYGTLYGDLAGTLGPLNDVTKPEVYELAELYPEIPEFIQTRSPSAELRPDQQDPFDYAVISAQVEQDVDRPGPYWPTIVKHEHKRRQGPIGLKVSERAFGSGRLVPVVQRWEPCYTPDSPVARVRAAL